MFWRGKIDSYTATMIDTQIEVFNGQKVSGRLQIDIIIFGNDEQI